LDYVSIPNWFDKKKKEGMIASSTSLAEIITVYPDRRVVVIFRIEEKVEGAYER